MQYVPALCLISLILLPTARTLTLGSVCEANQFACSLRGPCIPLRSLCDGVGDCPNSDDESRCGMIMWWSADFSSLNVVLLAIVFIAEESAVDVQVFEEMPVASGGNITLSCNAIGYPPPFVTWRKNLKPIPQNCRYNFTSQGGFGVLRIHDAGMEDAGEYHCEVLSELRGSRLIQPSVEIQVFDSKSGLEGGESENDNKVALPWPRYPREKIS